MIRFERLIREAHRRSLWQVLGIYLAASWVAIQVVETLTENLSLPEWVPPFAIVLLVIGLPVVLATAFVQEGVGSREASRDAGEDPGLARERVGAAGPRAPAPEPAGSAPGSAGPAAAPPGSPDRPVAAAASGRKGAGRRLFTWRNALVGGAAAFGLLVVVLGGWLASRALGIGPAATLVAKGVLEEQATIVLADFDSDDLNLSRAATEAFRIDLSQSRVVRLADPGFVREALIRMEREGARTLDLELALELAVREGLPAVLHGEIHEAGGRYVVSAALIDSEDGAVLASHRETAADSSQIVPAIDATSNRLRERIGESLPDLRGSAPLARVTTSDLEALRQYSQGARLGDMGEDERAVAFLEQAIARDSSFAMAHRKLAVVLRNRFEQRSRAHAALTRAFELRDRLTERERYLTEASYHYEVRRDLTRAAAAYESLLELDPDDDWALNNAGIIYGNQQRDYARAEPLFERAIAVDSLIAPPYFNLAVVQAAQGKLEAVDSTIALWARRLPSDPRPAAFAAQRAFQAGDWEDAESRGLAFLEGHGSNPALAADARDFLANTLSTVGRLAEARRYRREAEADQLRRGLPDEALSEAIARAWLDLVRREPETALRGFREAIDRYPLADFDPLDRPYPQIVFFLVEAGRPAEARRYLAEWESAEEGALARPVYWSARGVVEAAGGDLEEAVPHFRRADTGPCTVCTPIGLARAYDRASAADSAIAYYEMYLETGMLFRDGVDATNRGPALERLAQLYDEKGDLENAARYYAQFVELWAEADEALQPRVQAAQARLEEIVAERG